MKGTGISNNRGFTLLETMIALAIIAVALVSLLALGNRSIGVRARLQMITQATLLAQDKMSEIETLAEMRSSADFSDDDGTFDKPFQEFNWRVSYEDTPVASVKMVTVMVLWGDETKNEYVELTSFLFR